MNKLLAGAVAGLALGCMSAASAIDMSAGLSGSFIANFGGGSKDAKSSNTVMGGGFNGFFDLTYAEIIVGMTFASITGISVDGESVDSDFIPDNLTTFLNLGAFGKYPIAISDAFTIAPTVGIDYHLGLGQSVDGESVDFGDDYSAMDLSEFWIKFGASADFALAEKIYLRPALLYGIGFAVGNEDITGGDDRELSHGLTVKVGVGYKF